MTQRGRQSPGTLVALLTLPDALGTSLTIPLEMLNAAREIAQVRKRFGTGPRAGLQLAIVAEDTAPVGLTGGLVVQPTHRLADIARPDLLFIPGLWRSPEKIVLRHPEIVRWLAECYQQGSTLCSIGTGTYFLAQAGLLNNRAATTHWYYFDDFHQRYPTVKLQRRRFITLADRLYCTGSVNAARDVMLHFVEQLFDSGIANEVARHFTHEIKRSYESMLLDEEQQDTHHDELIIKVQEWMQAHFQEDVRLGNIADLFKLSVRSLNRRFKLATNNAPLQYLQEIRIEQAKELLKQSNLTVAEICYRVGYHDNSYFSGLFKELNGVTPVQYRNLVRTKLFRVEEN